MTREAVRLAARLRGSDGDRLRELAALLSREGCPCGQRLPRCVHREALARVVYPTLSIKEQPLTREAVRLATTDALDVFDEPRSWSQMRCCICGRFVSRESGRLVHEYGDYGSILSTEVECRRHHSEATA